MSHNHANTMSQISLAIASLVTETEKAECGNKSAAVRARKHASTAAKLLKQLREELLPLSK